MGGGFFDYLKDPRIKVVPSGETPELAKTLNMASWCFNRMLASGQLTGELIMYLCDDDILYPEAFATFWNYYTGHYRVPQAMYASQDIGMVDAAGQYENPRPADCGHGPAGKFCKGRRLDSRVDYLQFCHSRAILDKMKAKYRTAEFHREDRRHADHADGIFMEQIGALTTVYNINKLVSMNRRTASSVNLEYAESGLGRAAALLKAKIKGLRRLRDRGYMF